MSSTVLSIEPTYTMENLIETKMIRFRVNGKIDKRCKAFKREIVDLDGNIISAPTKKVTVEAEVEVLPPLEDIPNLKSDSCYSIDVEEFEGDERVENKQLSIGERWDCDKDDCCL